MEAKTILTDDAIHKLIVDLEIECDCGIETYPVDNIGPFARAIEQAVLQSPEVKALKRDKERIDWLADPQNNIGNVQLPTACVERNPHSLRDAIDDAMESMLVMDLRR